MLKLRLAGVALLTLLSATVAAFGQNVAAEAPRRVALVIGNGSYPQAPVGSLPGDARAFADVLRDDGFDVVYAENARRTEMEAAISVFTRKLGWGVTAVVYYGGHAVQYQDRNFLLAIDSKIATEADARTEGIDIDLILDPLIVSRPAGCVVILDAARKNPWQQIVSGRVRGLAHQPPIQGLTVIYPVAPGEVVGDAPRSANLFAVELLKSVKVPGLSFKEVFRRVRTSVAQATRDQQIPSESSPSPDDLVISSTRKTAATPAAPVRAADPVELGFWDTIKGSDNPADFKAYLDSYPDGAFAVIARTRLEQIEAKSANRTAVPAPPPPAPQPAAASQPPAAPQPPVASLPPAASQPAAVAQAVIRDCPQCPEMVLIAAGAFEMGSTEMFDFEAPVHQVSIRKPFYIGRREVTFEEWDACIAEAGCKQRPDDRGLGRARRPAIDLDWDDAKGYTAWLSQKTGHTYRLPTESEWEYAARAGSTTTYPWGKTVDKDKANCMGCTTDALKKAVDTGSFKPNAFGVYDMTGNAAEWVEDCWNDNYRGAPADGSAWTKPQCRERVLRGGSFNNDPRYLRSAARFKYDHDVRFYTNGFRVVREN